MVDSFTLDQLRTFVTVHEEGNFSAAARRLRRVQSAVSTTMANLEEQLGLKLWDRTTRIPTLTEQGQAMLVAAKRALSEIDAMRGLASDLVDGLEAKVSLCVDALFPVDTLVALAKAFAREFPRVDLWVDSQSMSAVSDAVLDGAATLGVVSPTGLNAELERQALAPIRMIAVVSPTCPLAQLPGLVKTRDLADHVQILLSEHRGSGAPDQAALSPRTWRVTDLHTKRTMLRAGVGWGVLPEHFVREDLAQRRLIAIRPAAWGDKEQTLTLSIIYRRDLTFGRAHRWLMNNLQHLCLNGEEVVPAPLRVASGGVAKHRRK